MSAPLRSHVVRLALAVLLAVFAIHPTVRDAVILTVPQTESESNDDDDREVELVAAASVRQVLCPNRSAQLVTRASHPVCSTQAPFPHAPVPRNPFADPLGARLRC